MINNRNWCFGNYCTISHEIIAQIRIDVLRFHIFIVYYFIQSLRSNNVEAFSRYKRYQFPSRLMPIENLGRDHRHCNSFRVCPGWLLFFSRWNANGITPATLPSALCYYFFKANLRPQDFQPILLSFGENYYRFSLVSRWPRAFFSLRQPQSRSSLLPFDRYFSNFNSNERLISTLIKIFFYLISTQLFLRANITLSQFLFWILIVRNGFYKFRDLIKVYFKSNMRYLASYLTRGCSTEWLRDVDA